MQQHAYQKFKAQMQVMQAPVCNGLHDALQPYLQHGMHCNNLPECQCMVQSIKLGDIECCWLGRSQAPVPIKSSHVIPGIWCNSLPFVHLLVMFLRCRHETECKAAMAAMRADQLPLFGKQ